MMEPGLSYIHIFPAVITGSLKDIPGFCALAPVERVKERDYVLTQGRYVGLPDEEDDFELTERFTALNAEPERQMKEEAALNKTILDNLKRIKPVDGK